ncbi:hypothetical protein [Rhizobium ruizarguesonis]|uniref:hypothetical protein n=1 Tax=Rhizobium ruizarguesonis TaxID=2081791 RepID=UPI0004097B51|nr:hypothetical protein [Rhizobium ruizarguesonis]QJS27433.1 hypothetical protein RLTA1_09090 [Rhizobium leguminosarum bv. trifolii TA1]UFW96182.1 hypothetical protein RlegTA1_09055 [Rhizobium ruizarguesonis]
MSKKFSAHQHILISGSECGTEIELKMVVAFTVHPGCKQTLTEPGEEPSVEVDKVQFFDGKDELTLPWSIADRFTSGDGFKDWLMYEAAAQHEAALDAKAEARRDELRMGDIL